MALPTGTPVPAVADFLRDLGRSRAVEPARVEELFADAPPDRKRRPDAFAEHLVGLGELTKFQADKLLRGHWRGLALGPYRLLCPLGRGGMGVVYLARSAGGPPIALKVLPPQRARDEPRMLTRFHREIDVGRKLPPHPHLARTLDAGVCSGVHYLAMEYVPGRTVRQLVAEAGPLSVGQAARVFADVAAGLHQAHRAGFVHRDLKPSNVVVTPAGRAKLLDFGFALVRGEPAPTDPTLLGGPGYAVGTMDYVAPEQSADPVSVGPASDLYSLGCSLYFAVAGCPPFPGGTPQDKIRWQRTVDPPQVSQINPAVPAEFAGLIEWLMAKDQSARPQSAEEAAKRLAGWADPIRPEPVVGPPPSAEALRLAEASWRAARDTDPTAEDESLIILDDDPAPKPPIRVPNWFLALAGAGCLLALAAAAALGWAIALWSAR
jgi:serine/threonine protein kinase